MHPAPSVILFTVLSGVGFGFLCVLNLGLIHPTGLGGLVAFAIGYAFAVAGLLASTFHLGNPQRALRAFTQWRTSWLSREGWASVAALLATAPVALGAMGGMRPGLWGLVAAALCVTTVFCTSMIYAQLKTVPRWNHWIVPLTFLAFAAIGGMILSGIGWPAAVLCLILAGVMAAGWRIGDGRFAASGTSVESATGLGGIGAVRPFQPPHTSANYVMKEMIHQVGRKHVRKLRIVAVVAGAVVPALVLVALPSGLPAAGVALVVHLAGAFAQRWLFFAEAEHVVSHYYGRGG
jgi:DMSO reductase anchor subunit